jgi:hypothetical protein
MRYCSRVTMVRLLYARWVHHASHLAYTRGRSILRGAWGVKCGRALSWCGQRLGLHRTDGVSMIGNVPLPVVRHVVCRVSSDS